MQTSNVPYRNWKTTFDVKLLRLVRTSCRPLSQKNEASRSALPGQWWRTFPASPLVSKCFSWSKVCSLWDIRIFLGLVPKESHCMSPLILKLGKIWTWALRFTPRLIYLGTTARGTHWTGGWVGPETAELTNSLRTWSGTLRELLQSACADECEKITGARLIRSASNIVGTDTWDKSTIMPSRFISRTTDCNE